MNKFIKTITFAEIWKGMGLTMKYFIKSLVDKPITRLYPFEPREAMPGFRGLHSLIRDPRTGREKCVACGLCAASCPSQCITIHTGEGARQDKVAERYEVDVLRCLFCGICVEACPVGAIALTGHYAYAGYDKKAFYLDKEQLLANWDKYLAGPKGDEYLTRFWQPGANSYRAYTGQAVWDKGTGKASGYRPAEAAGRKEEGAR